MVVASSLRLAGLDRGALNGCLILREVSAEGSVGHFW